MKKGPAWYYNKGAIHGYGDRNYVRIWKVEVLEDDVRWPDTKFVKKIVGSFPMETFKPGQAGLMDAMHLYKIPTDVKRAVIEDMFTITGQWMV